MDETDQLVKHPWSVGTEKNPMMFNNTDSLTEESVLLGVDRSSFIWSKGGLISLDVFDYNILFDPENDAHLLFASIQYVVEKLNETPVVDYGGYGYEAFMQMADPTKYDETSVF